MIALISEEYKNTSGSTRSVILRKIHKWQDFRLVILLVVIIYRGIILVASLYIQFVYYL